MLVRHGLKRRAGTVPRSTGSQCKLNGTVLKAGHAYSLYACHYQVQHPGESTSTGGRDGTMAVWADQEVLKQ